MLMLPLATIKIDYRLNILFSVPLAVVLLIYIALSIDSFFKYGVHSFAEIVMVISWSLLFVCCVSTFIYRSKIIIYPNCLQINHLPYIRKSIKLDDIISIYSAYAEMDSITNYILRWKCGCYSRQNCYYIKTKSETVIISIDKRDMKKWKDFITVYKNSK